MYFLPPANLKTWLRAWIVGNLISWCLTDFLPRLWETL